MNNKHDITEHLRTDNCKLKIKLVWTLGSRFVHMRCLESGRKLRSFPIQTTKQLPSKCDARITMKRAWAIIRQAPGDVQVMKERVKP